MLSTILKLLDDFQQEIDVYAITKAELEVLKIIDRGTLSIKAIAEDLCRSPRTVENQLQSIYRKLGVSGKEELLKKLWKHQENEEIIIATRF